MNINKIKRKTLPFLKKHLYPLVNLYNSFDKNSERLISRNEIFLHNKDYNKITRDNKKFSINVDNFEEEINTNIDKNIPSIFGWVPYLKNKSNVLIYHFFSINYSLRKNFLIRLSLIKGLEVKKQNCFWMPPMDIKEIDLINLWKDLEGNSVFVEVFHPKIPLNHGNQDGHLRYWGNYYNAEKDLKATVHSLPQEKKIKYQIKDMFSRSLISSYNNEHTLHFSAGNKIHKEKDEILTHMGFNMIVDKNNDPLSTWHDGAAHSKNINLNKTEDSKGKIYETTQGFWCPPIKNLDPLIFIDERETKLNKNRILFLIIKDKEIIESKSLDTEGSVKIKISKIFGKKIPAPYGIVCKLKYKTKPKIVIRYDTENSSGDCVHAWDCKWKIENRKLTPEIIDNKSTARKFFYFKNNFANNDIKYFLLLYVTKKKHLLDNFLKIRILLDNKKEFLKTINLNFDEPMPTFDLKDFIDLNTAENFTNGIMQIESQYDNILSTFFICDLKKNTVITDHLTGG